MVNPNVDQFGLWARKTCSLGGEHMESGYNIIKVMGMF